MKAIISHDIDHFTLSEHYFRDLIVPKFFIRSKIEFLIGKITFKELILRYSDLVTNKWQNINELIDFDIERNIPATFFVAVEKGKGLNYSNHIAKKWVQIILEKGFEVGLHGIEFENYNKIKEEHDAFSLLSGLTDFGCRMHYVRTNECTYQNMSKISFAFDSSEYDIRAPYKIGKMWQFPFQIMDGYLIQKPKQWQCKNLEQAKNETKRILEDCYKNNLPYIGIDFHDRYFSNRFVTWRDWYVWLIDLLISEKIEFVNYETAIKKLEKREYLRSSEFNIPIIL